MERLFVSCNFVGFSVLFSCQISAHFVVLKFSANIFSTRKQIQEDRKTAKISSFAHL
jgi:hypothetical protein